MGACLPTLSLDGFITDKKILMSKIWENFLTSDYSQSNTFHGDISSLKFLVAYKSYDEISVEIENTLTTLYKKYYDSVHVIIEQKPFENNTSYIVFEVDITGTDENGVVHRLSKSIELSPGNPAKYDDLLAELNKVYS